LGDGSATARSVPTRIGDGFLAIAAAKAHSLALRRDGTLWSWGANANGQLGNGLFGSALAPQLVVSENLDGFLDLVVGTANDIPAALVPPFLAKVAKAGDLSSLSLSVDVRGLLGDVRARSSTGHQVYVAANAGAGGTLAWFQLDAGGSWSALSWPMAAFMTGVSLASRTDSVIVEILDGVDVSGLIGSHIYVGYGTDADEMLAAGRYREVMTIADPAAQ
jgi:hypothetical protein